MGDLRGTAKDRIRDKVILGRCAFDVHESTCSDGWAAGGGCKSSWYLLEAEVDNGEWGRSL